MNEARRVTPQRFRVIAVILVLSAAFHFMAAWVPAFDESIGSSAPKWRHLVFTGIEGALALLMLRRPRWLPLILLLFLGQQLTTHGVQLGRQLVRDHRIDWMSLVVLAFLTGVLLIVIRDQQRTTRSFSKPS